MTEPVKPLDLGIDSFSIAPKGGENVVVEGGDRFCHERDVVALKERVIATIADLEAKLAEAERKGNGYQAECREVEQVLGKALGYPWFKDDPANFPGATEADGVCVGDHVPSSIAAETATKLSTERAAGYRAGMAKYEALKEYVVGRVEWTRARAIGPINGRELWARLHGLIAMIDKKSLDAWQAVEDMTPEERQQCANELEYAILAEAEKPEGKEG